MRHLQSSASLVAEWTNEAVRMFFAPTLWLFKAFRALLPLVALVVAAPALVLAEILQAPRPRALGLSFAERPGVLRPVFWYLARDFWTRAKAIAVGPRGTRNSSN